VSEDVGVAEVLPGRLERLEQRAVVGPVVETARRFFAIDGLDLGALIALELFTTTMPLLLIGYAWIKDFDRAAVIGDLFVRQLGVDGADRAIIRRAFGTAAGLERVWTVAGMAGFLVWGVPMSLTVSRTFSQAWRRPLRSLGQRLWRGTLWFVLYLATVGVTEQATLAASSGVARPAMYGVTFLMSTLFWGATPLLLVPGIPWRWRTVLAAGLVGAVVNVVVLRIAMRLVVPVLLSGWDGFGPIGVAMTLMTWSGVLGVTWVIAACGGAVLSERGAR
jgi:hypothetical protein